MNLVPTGDRKGHAPAAHVPVIAKPTGGKDSVAALLFEREKVEPVGDWESRIEGLDESSVIWIDVTEPDETVAHRLAEALALSPASVDRLLTSERRAYFADCGSYLHVTAHAPPGAGEDGRLSRIDCLVSTSWIATVHEGTVPVIDEFSERVRAGTGETGKLDGLEFLANLLEWVLDAYLRAFDEVEDVLGELDTRVMDGRLDDPEDVLRRLVALRRRVRDIRRALVSHREMLLALTRPELEEIASSTHAQRFDSLRSRLEEAVQGARDSRDSIVASFDVLIARNEQRQNEIMKVLTLVSVLFLPGALVAGLLGMNFKVGLFDQPWLFWVVLGAIGAMIGTTLVTARIRRWI